MFRRGFVSILLLSTWSGHADWTWRPQAGLGVTNNANFEESERDADLYWFLRQIAILSRRHRDWSASLSYQAYKEQIQNDVFSWRLGTTAPGELKSLGPLEMDFGIGGQHYTRTNPGTTEESFDFVYVEGSAAMVKMLKPETEIRFGPGYQLREFPHFSGRIDHTLFFNSTLDWSYSPGHSLSPFAEVGLVFSNDELYRRRYLEIGADWRHFIRKDLRANLNFLSRFSTYPDRPLSAATLITNKRGIRKLSSRQEIETQNYVQLKAALVKIIDNLELNASAHIHHQGSKSGYEDYTEIGLIGSVTLVF